MRRFVSLLLLACSFASVAVFAEPLIDPIPETIEFGEVDVELREIASGMVAPLHVTYAPGDATRVFVADQVGVVYAIDLATGTKTVFLDIASRIAINLGGYDERGLLGLAFHPDYQSNGLFYTYTSEPTDGVADFPWSGITFGPHQSVISEWQVNAPGNLAEVADPSSRREVMRVDQPTGFHNAGALTFDLDGYLFIALGNGGPLETGQDNSNVLGSVLRIVPNANFAPLGNHATSANGAYLIPDTNPFLADIDAHDEIFAHGFRNPYRLTIDRVTNDIYVGEVGNNDIEEVNLVIAGGNYGFNVREGSFCFVGQGGQPNGEPGVADPSECVAESVGMIDPLAQYDHDEGISVIGGYVYRADTLGALTGDYVFADLNARLLHLNGTTIEELNVVGPTAVGGAVLGMGEDANGELYVVSNNFGRTSGTTGRLLRIEAAAPVASAASDWSQSLKSFYASQGDPSANADFIDATVAAAHTASESGDVADLVDLRRRLSAFISAVTWGRAAGWGAPPVTEAQADALIMAAQSLLDSLPEFLEDGLYSRRTRDGRDRSYYLKLPSDYADTKGEKPVIIGFHGSFASHLSWVGPNPRYTFVDVVGDGAIMVFPDALPLGAGAPNWNFEYDFGFFADLIKELDRLGVEYDKNKLFVTGHSSGAGMAQEAGCRYGDIVRAIAASSGSLVSNQCIGSIAVIQSQGEVDTAVPPTIGAAAHNFWTLYNGWDISMSTPGDVAPCIDHSLLPLGSADYPVQWCLHPGGHPWPDFASDAFWGFFSGLPDVAPTTDHPPGGGNERVLAEADTTISFTLNYPADMGPVVAGAITLYPPEFCKEIFAAPSVFLNINWNPGDVAPGSTVTYENIPITFFVFGGEFVTPSDHKLQIAIYNEGGSQPIPTPGVDHIVVQPITIQDTTTPIIISEAYDVEDVVPFTNVCP